MKTCVTFAAIAVMSAAGLGAQAGKKEEPITLSGCVGEGLDKGTYYVANMIRVPYEGMSIGTEPNAIFALDSPGKLKKHINHRVEIRGVVEQNKNAQGRVEAAGDGMHVDAKGRKRTRIPHEVEAARAAASGGVDVERRTYKVDVDEVTRIPNTEGCLDRK